MTPAICASAAERGLDTLLIDTDFEINGDVWAVLGSPPLLPYHIIGLAEGPLNGGTMFVRRGPGLARACFAPSGLGRAASPPPARRPLTQSPRGAHAGPGACCRGSKAHPKGAALWMIREVERQTSLFRDAEFADPEHPYDPGRKDDQARRAQEGGGRLSGFTSRCAGITALQAIRSTHLLLLLFLCARAGDPQGGAQGRDERAQRVPGAAGGGLPREGLPDLHAARP